MIDLHSHILPGIDDGARTLNDALAMAEQAYEQGVRHIVCTPHIHLGTFDNSAQIIEDSFTAFVDEVHKRSLDIKFSYACEMRACAEIIQLVGASALPYLGHWENKAALLLELPHSHIPAGIENLISWLIKHQIQPIIPHPERNREILANYDKVTWLKKLGVLFQATAGAYTGTFGEAVKITALNMLNDKLTHYVASDMHNVHRRPNEMRDAYVFLSEEIEQAYVQSLFYDVPEQITSQTSWQ
ncbi:tyrosine-protein phosphatase [Glaciecola siphonariae]|uniref:protein-tyrosine-phosphatase n=1 Tax=Glaciecola siphonariae TaxID=521012 RepID=A0ABV9LZK8_9ALTE